MHKISTPRKYRRLGQPQPEQWKARSSLITEQQFSEAAERLRQGDLVAFPTETVYGLAANALDSVAVAKIFELKGRPTFDPLIVHVANREDLLNLVTEVPRPIEQLIDRFWPGPLSVVLPRHSIVPDLVTSGLPSVAVRCPSHPVARRLIEESGVPLAAPSANRFGRISPTTAEHVREQFTESLTTILDGGPCEVGVESTVVGYDGTHVILYRPGGITVEEIIEEVGEIKIAGTDDKTPSSPGQLTQHYAPRTRMTISAQRLPKPHENRVGLLALSETEPITDQSAFAAIEFLSKDGSLREAAANLFAAMRRLDEQDLDLIIARPVPERDLGLAIMDRLRRASAR